MAIIYMMSMNELWMVFPINIYPNKSSMAICLSDENESKFSL